LKWWAWNLGAKPTPRSTKRALVRSPPAPITKSTAALSPLTFVEMTSAIDIDRLEVVLPTSVRIRVRPGFDVPTLGRLLEVLEARR
jgi:hypothetical protein